MPQVTAVIIVGAGAFGREVLDWVRAMPGHGSAWAVTGFLDDHPGALAGFEVGLPVLGPATDHVPLAGTRYVGALGQVGAKQRVLGALYARGAQFMPVIHPSAIVGSRAVLGTGVILCPRATLSCDTRLGDFVTINLHSTVTHDVRIGAWSQISDHVDLCGGAVLGEGVMVGSGARVLPGVQVGDGAVLGAGSVVVRDVPAQVTVMGNPARPLPSSGVYSRIN